MRSQELEPDPGSGADDDKGHGNDNDGSDEDNPGNSVSGNDKDGKDGDDGDHQDSDGGWTETVEESHHGSSGDTDVLGYVFVKRMGRYYSHQCVKHYLF